MSRHTTFRIGGPADRLVRVSAEAQLTALIKELREREIPWMILGNGSNLLVGDKGYRGVMVALDGAFKEMRLQPDGVTVWAGAAVPLSGLCAFAREHSLSGLEFAWGIPGTVGGAVYMNAGAYGGETADVVTEALHLTPAGERVTASGKELGFGYRKSRYTDRGDTILSAVYGLTPGSREEIAAKMEELMTRRKDKQPYDMPSAGSVFKRPVNGFAAALIEECGLKGKAVGGAQVSPKHSGFIVNTGGATCRDVLELIEIVQNQVAAQKGVDLEREVKLVGEV